MELFSAAVAYSCLLVFIGAVIARCLMWIRLPRHVRWELYPIAHAGRRAHYGGSYMEDQEWWKKPHRASLFGEFKVMIPEMLFLKSLKEHNPKLWLRSFPFHFGLYLVAGCLLLLASRSLLSAFLPGFLSGWLCIWLENLIGFVFAAGLILSILGASGLLQRRVFDATARDFSAPADYFNLVFFILAFLFTFINFLVFDPQMNRLAGFIRGLIAFDPRPFTGSVPAVIAGNTVVIILSLLLAYIPLTHMSHFMGKYMAYHSVRWNDRPNLGEADLATKMEKSFNYPVSWSAEHIAGDGKKTWAEVVMGGMKK